MTLIPTTCTCGTEMAGTYEHVGDYGSSPAYEMQGQYCPDCGQTDESILENHNPETCGVPECAWCVVVREEAEVAG